MPACGPGDRGQPLWRGMAARPARRRKSRFLTEFYQPIGYASNWFVAPRILVERRNFDILEDDERLATIRVRNAEVGFDFGREFGSWGEMRAGLSRRRQPEPAGGRPDSPGLPLRDGFQQRGVHGALSVTGSTTSTSRARRADDAAMERAARNARRRREFGSGLVRLDDRAIVWPKYADLSASGGSHVSGPTEPVQDLYSLGGLFNLSGLSPDSISGPHFAVARAILYRHIGSGEDGFLNVPIYLGASLELGNVWESRSDISVSSARVNGAAFLGFDTFLGPVYLAAGFDEGGERGLFTCCSAASADCGSARGAGDLLVDDRGLVAATRIEVARPTCRQAPRRARARWRTSAASASRRRPGA